MGLRQWRARREVDALERRAQAQIDEYPDEYLKQIGPFSFVVGKGLRTVTVCIDHSARWPVSITPDVCKEIYAALGDAIAVATCNGLRSVDWKKERGAQEARDAQA